MERRKFTDSALKRGIDICVASVGLTCVAPLIVLALMLTWGCDRHTPIYRAQRVGKGGRPFTMYEVRTMVVGSDRTGVDSTAKDDSRITPIGHLVRLSKADELPQLVNVIRGDMSLVGPRPNVEREIAFYTPAEHRLLDVRPGVTDLSSIVFSDLAEILKSREDANLAYRQLVRPWKSRFGLFYIDHASLALDLQIIAYTALVLVSPSLARRAVQRVLRGHGADARLVEIAGRSRPLAPYPPPGGSEGP